MIKFKQFKITLIVLKNKNYHPKRRLDHSISIFLKKKMKTDELTRSK